jgi:hypothetical protein
MADKFDAKLTELQTFSYHSGAQISVWFEDIWINDISSISWQYSQEKRPLYGYASTYFDAVARGQVMIQGNFTINFRQRDYISFVINNLRNLATDLKTSVSREDQTSRWDAVKPRIASHLRNGTFGPQSLQDVRELGQREDFWDVVDRYEKVLWETLSDQEKERLGAPDVLQHEWKPEGFDIQIIYGEVVDKRSETPYDVMSSTTKTLKGVHLVGTSQMIQANGEPIQEGYAFFAKDIY